MSANETDYFNWAEQVSRNDPELRALYNDMMKSQHYQGAPGLASSYFDVSKNVGTYAARQAAAAWSDLFGEGELPYFEPATESSDIPLWDVATKGIKLKPGTGRGIRRSAYDETFSAEEGGLSRRTIEAQTGGGLGEFLTSPEESELKWWATRAPLEGLLGFQEITEDALTALDLLGLGAVSKTHTGKTVGQWIGLKALPKTPFFEAAEKAGRLFDITGDYSKVNAARKAIKPDIAQQYLTLRQGGIDPRGARDILSGLAPGGIDDVLNASAREAAPAIDNAATAASKLDVGFEPTRQTAELDAILQRGIDQSQVDDILSGATKSVDEAQAAAGEAPVAMVLDAMPPEQMLDEAAVMAKKAGLYGDIADDVAAKAAADTFESLQGMEADPTRNAIGKIRATLSGKIKNAIRSEGQTPLGITGRGRATVGKEQQEMYEYIKNLKPEAGEEYWRSWAKENAAVRTHDYDVVFGEKIDPDEMYSMVRREGGREEAFKRISSHPGIKSAKETAEGMEIETIGGRKARIIRRDIIEGGKGPGEAAGRFIMETDGIGQIELSKLATKNTADHELVHWGRAIGAFTDDDWNRLSALYAPNMTEGAKIEEAIARGLASDPAEIGLVRRIIEFFSNIYESVSGGSTAVGARKRWRTGEVLANAGDINDPLPFLRKGHIKGALAKDPSLTTFDQIFAGRASQRVYDRFRVAWTDDLARIRDLMEKSAAGKLVHEGRVVANRLLQNISGRLVMSEDVIKNGIRTPGTTDQWLYKGNMVEDLTGPVNKYLQKKHGIVRTKDADELLSMSDNYLVSKRAIWLYDDAMRGANAAADLIDTGKQIGRDNPLVFRNILQDYQLEKAHTLEGQELRQFLGNAVERWAAENTGIGASGIGDIDAARRMISYAESDPDLYKALEGVREFVRGVNGARLEYVHMKGLINDAAYEALKLQGDDYVALQRVLEPNMHINAGGSGGELVQTLKGGEREILNPVTGSVDAAVNWMRRADINEVFQRYFQQTDEFELAEEGIRKVSEAGPNVKSVWIDGEKTFWKFDDPDLYADFERIGKAEPNDPFTKILTLPRRMIQKTVTTSPGYVARNLIRDKVLQQITTLNDVKLGDIIRKFDEESILRFKYAGGDQAGYHGSARRSYAQEVERAISEIAQDDKNIMMHVDDFGSFLRNKFDKWKGVASDSERHTRMSEFVAAQRRYKEMFPDLAEAEIDILAAGDSRDLMDFAIGGIYARRIGKYVPFFNPAIQGARKLWNTADTLGGKEFMLRLGKYVGIPSIGCMMYNRAVGAEKEYRQLPAYRRDLFWNFKVGDRWFVAPKPFEAGALGTLFERGADFVMRGGDMQAFEGYMGSLFRSVSPADEALLVGGLRPVIEAFVINRDLFQDRYIIPPHEEGLDPRLRKLAAKASTVGKAMSAISGWTGIGEDPRQWDHFIKSIFADYGRLAVDLTSEKKGLVVHDLTGGTVRRTSPWALLAVQNVLEEGERKGLNRKKAHKKFVQTLRRADEDPSKSNIDSVLREADFMRKKYARVTIDDILRKTK